MKNEQNIKNEINIAKEIASAKKILEHAIQFLQNANPDNYMYAEYTLKQSLNVLNYTIESIEKEA